MLFDIDTGVTANVSDQILAVPLPAPKAIWEAATECEWKREFTYHLTRTEGKAVLTYGDLVRFRQSNSLVEDPKFDELIYWCSNFDAFGNFILMTAMSL